METSDQEALNFKKKEQRKKYYKTKCEKEQSILEKAKELRSQNKEMSLGENDILRKAEEINAKRLKMKQDYINRKAAATPEELEARRLKTLEHNRRFYLNRKAKATLEEIEAMRLKISEQSRKYSKERRDKEESIKKKSMELLSQNRELSLEENDVVRKAEEIKAKRLKKKQNFQNRKAAATPEEVKAMRLKHSERNRRSYLNRKAKSTPEEIKERRFLNSQRTRRLRQKRKSAATPEEIEAMRLTHSERSRKYQQEKRVKEESILRKAMEFLSQNQEMSLEQEEILTKAKQIKALRLKLSEHEKRRILERKAAASSEKTEAMRLRKLENGRHYRQKKRDLEKLILKKAMELSSQNEELSLEDNFIVRKAEEIKAKRLKRKQLYLNRKAAATPEELEVMRLKKLAQMRRFRQNRKAIAKPEVEEAMKLNSLEQKRQYCHVKREDSILRQAAELLGRNQEMSSDKKEVLRLAENIKFDRLRKSEYEKQFMIKNTSGRPRIDQVFDEIKIEKEVLQETTIKAISARQNANSVLYMQQGGYNDSSCSWLALSEKSFMTGETSSYFQSFHGGSSSIQFDRRKLGLEKSFRCMRVLIDATAKRNGPSLFGKQIAQKLRSSKKNVAEVNIAKQLIEDILENLAIGVYSFETKIV